MKHRTLNSMFSALLLTLAGAQTTTSAHASDATEIFNWPWGLYAKEDGVVREDFPYREYSDYLVIRLKPEDAGRVDIDPAYWKSLGKMTEQQTGFFIQPRFHLSSGFWSVTVRGVAGDRAVELARQELTATGMFVTVEKDPVIRLWPVTHGDAVK